MMNPLEKQLQQLNPSLYSKFLETKQEVNLLLGKYSDNFKTYTDHSINHTMEVFEIASEILSKEELENLNGDEIYILSMSCLLHDIGMCIPEDRISEISDNQELIDHRKSHPNLSQEEFLRDVHHILSYKFIKHEWELLKIPSQKYAEAIGLVSKGHRKVELGNFDIYDPQYFAKGGKEFTCLPYLSIILRIADELDITNSRTPRILVKYYMPNNEVSIREWSKHIATSQRNYINNKVIYEVSCSDQNIYAALQEQQEKIQNVINYGQKIVRAIPFMKDRHFSLDLSTVEFKYNFEGFDPKGIKFSFDVQNVVNAFIGEDLYKDNLTAIREAIQNSIDSCRYNIKVLKNKYIPKIKISLTDKSITIEDNGAGMDIFIIENFFGRLASSFYEQEKVKTQFEAIGQFGVGVFSYFLLSQYIDIETKSKNSEALKFRFDKDPKSYFHFFDNAEREETGTTITMNLKEEFCEKFDFSTIEKYIRTIFTHVEIPIEITDGLMYSKIEGLKFEIDHKKEIRERLKLHNRNIGLKLNIVEAKINNSDIEGICGLIVAKNYKDTFSIGSEYFDYESFNNSDSGRKMSQISVSQKGIFVNNYGHSSTNLLLGMINLKNKIKINIDRNSFSDIEPIKKYIRQFEILTFEKLFLQLEKKYKNDEEKLQITDSFLTNYFSYVYIKDDSSEYSNRLGKYIYCKIYHNNEYKTININELDKISSEIILVSQLVDEKYVYEIFKLPIVIIPAKEFYAYNKYENVISNLLTYHKTIFYYKNIGYLKMIKRSQEKDYYEGIRKIYTLVGRYYELTNSNSKLLYVHYWSYQRDSTLNIEYSLNYNHPLIQFLIINFEKLINDSEIKKVIKAALSYLSEIESSYEIGETETLIDKSQIKKINEILKPLKNFGNFKNLTLSDFPN